MLKRKLMNMMRSADRAPHQRGSAVLLVIVSLVLMVVLGAVYLQTARVQRFPQTQQGDLDAVIAAIIAQIQTTLKDDITNGEELYDYPWTDQTSADTWSIETFDGTSALADGNVDDDVWLAATSPDFPTLPAVPFWQHITNLNGLFLDYDNSTGQFNEAGTTGIPTEYPVNFDDALRSDTGLTLDSTQLVDADGDGIVDSRWTWAPIKQINGVTYVMAARIIDLSSLVNANTALSLGRDTGSVYEMDPATHAPLWNAPSELDLGRWRYNIEGSPQDSEIVDSLKYRTGNTTLIDSLVPGTTRDNFWGNTGRFYPWMGATPTTGNLYPTTDELELRWRNGFNSDRVADIENPTDGWPAFLRSGPAETPPVLSKPHDATQWLTIQSHFEEEPRNQLTTMSGAATFVWPRTGTVTPADPASDDTWFKVDLNAASGSRIADEISHSYNGAPSAPGGLPTLAAFSAQFAANIVDYRDTNNLLSTIDGTHYGLEPLPFIAEVYVQRPYTASGATPNATVPTSFNTTWDDGGNAGYAIELRNPFPVDADLSTVNLWVDGVDWGPLATLAAPLTALPAGETLILYRDSNASTGPNDDVTALFNGAVTYQVAITNDWPTTAWGEDLVAGTITRAPVRIELRATDSSGTALGWPYAVSTSWSMPDDFVEVTTVDHTAGPTQGYEQAFSLGHGDGLNVITVRESDVALSPAATGQSVIPTAYDTTTDKLNEDGKQVGPPLTAANEHQAIIRNASFVHVGELAHVLVLGPSATETVADRWAANTDSRAFMLNFASGSVGADNLDVPHAVYMMDRFTTISPMDDGVNNDGAGSTDDDGEYIIPGLVNLNTAPLHVLKGLLSIPDDTLREDDVIARIIAYRENNAAIRTAMGYGRTNPGLAFTGELFRLTSDLLTTAPFAGDTPAIIDAGSGGPVQVDFSDASGAIPDGIIDDREEEAMIATWLSQVGSTRSDFYAAYVVVRGYKMDEFDAPAAAGVLEAAQFIAIFKRDAKSGEVTVQTVGTAPFMVN